MSPLFIGLFGFLAVIILIMLGFHIGLALGFVGVIGLILLSGNFKIALSTLTTNPFWTVFSYDLIIIPLFVLMGTFASYGGFGRDLYSASSKWLGRVPGGLGIATVWTSLLFGAASGSNVAAAAVFTKISLPEMTQRNYDAKFSVGTIVASSMLTVIMPPSLVLVLYGIFTEQSIAKLLIAGVIPSIIVAIGLSCYLWLRVRIVPNIAPLDNTPVSWRDKIIAAKNAWMIILLALVVLGGIYGGVFTPTEAAGVGSFVAFAIGLVRRHLNWHNIVASLVETVMFSAMIFFILIGAYIFIRFLLLSGFTNSLLGLLLSVNIPNILIIIALMIVYLILGCFMDALSMMAITLPIVFPAIKGLGYDGIWFGIIFLMASVIGAMTPPFGMSVYAVKSATDIDMSIEDMFKACIPYIFVTFVIWAILIAFPKISTFLPDLMLGP
jgi:C4-dicarboxylate transporter DctM subunit